MNGIAEWQKNNDTYLATALKWLRLRLAEAVGHASASPPEESHHWWNFIGRQNDVALNASEPVDADNDGAGVELETAAAEMAAAEHADPPPALVILGQRLGLSRFEQQVLLLCAAMELDTRIPRLCAMAQDDPGKPYPTFALAMALLNEPAWDALSPERPLRYLRLIEINQPGAQPLISSALRADERIVSYIKGLNYLDDRLSPLLTAVERADVPLPLSQQRVADAIMHQLQRGSSMRRLPVIQLTGLDSGSKLLLAGRVASALGLHLYRLPAAALPAQLAEMDTFARLWERETLLLPVTLYLDAREADPATPEMTGHTATPLNRLLEHCNRLFFLDTREVWPSLSNRTSVFDVSTPTPVEQLKAWQNALGSAASGSPALLAGQFNLNMETIGNIARTALAETNNDDVAVTECLWAACLASMRPRLETLAQRIEPKSTWDDIVLPAEATGLLHQVADQVMQRTKVYEEWGFNRKMNRGLGINALFAGESGTGKTMAAEVIANELKLDLYRIDLSAVVNKYIGETEKNLRRLFDAAEDGGAILFFDEADALFGKRSEVKDSHDRYANIEVNYLLQRMEAYRGLAILATNMKSALDQAFMRRLRFIVNFPFPSPAERKLIWERAFPKDDQERSLSGTPIDALDYDHLARLNLPGGSIHNVALNAAFLAARTGESVTMPLIFEAARTEFRKLEKPVSEGDFRWLNSVGG
jgi:ATP-dependent 26S proteasome regulatory subunit